ncbi:MAG: copper chaperone PCu(A)C [Gammaproteobacteria bacterium]|nr:copper chaperone PCu(A)C [Gammaproteobacteria bacterium]
MRSTFFKNSLLAVIIGFSPFTYAAESTVHAAETIKGQYVATVASIGIEQPWSRALPPTAHTGATFVSIYNQGRADRLMSAYSPVAEKTELHNHIHQDGLMKMVEVEFIDVPANGTLELKPGSFHIMLIGLKQSLNEGEHFPIRLDFEQAGSVELEVQVKDMNAGTGAEHLHH